MFSLNLIASAMAIAVLGPATGVAAGYVCKEYEIAVGYEVNYAASPGSQSIPYYTGFEMTNNCKLIAQNGQTQDRNQMCRGGFSSGADITCSDPEHVSAAKDTSGKSYTCRNSGYDSSCDVTSGITSFYVSGCCSPN